MTALSTINEMAIGAGLMAILMLGMVAFIVGAISFVRSERAKVAERLDKIDEMHASIRRSGSYRMAAPVRSNGVHPSGAYPSGRV